MTAVPVLVGTLCIFAISYRYYSAFLATKVFVLNQKSETPAFTHKDNQNYYPMSKWVLFGHHFAAISGAGPLIGPVLAAQFGFLPGLLWIVVGVVLGGAVQDFIILTVSTRQGGRSLAEIAGEEIGRPAGFACALAILFIVVVALAGLGFVVVNALAESSWGLFTIAASIPIAMVMGLYIFGKHQGSHSAVKIATVFGVLALFSAVIFGRFVPDIPFLNNIFLLDKKHIIVLMGIYGFAASVLPVWLLLAPRDYLSSYMKLGTIFLLIAGTCFVNPTLHIPAVTSFIHGGGPIVPGKVWPFCFITIMCGAISGFHALVSSGTTPKMISNECHIRPIGYGCMLLEALVAVVSLVAVSALYPGDYYAINVAPEAFAKLQASGITPVNLDALTKAVGEKSLAGRTGGAVSLAVGMAQIMSSIRGLGGLMKYWYHFAIMFEALFILTTIDAGTRIARFIVQEFFGKIYKPFAQASWLPGNIFASFIVVGGWCYLIWNSSISTIWPMFGIANQLLASIALTVGSVVLVRMGKKKYLWVTLLPFTFVTATTLGAAYQMVTQHFWPKTATAFIVSLNTALIVSMVALSVFIFLSALLRCVSGKRKERVMAGILLAVFVPLFSPPAFADMIEIKGKGFMNGKVLSEDESGLSFQDSNGATLKVAKKDVLFLEKGSDSGSSSGSGFPKLSLPKMNSKSSSGGKKSGSPAKSSAAAPPPKAPAPRPASKPSAPSVKPKPKAPEDKSFGKGFSMKSLSKEKSSEGDGKPSFDSLDSKGANFKSL